MFSLLLLLIVAAILGYWLANSRYHKTIDQAAEKAAKTSRSWTDSATNWLQTSVLRRKEKQEEQSEGSETVDNTEDVQPAPEEQEARPAKKRTSRRKTDDAEG